MDVTPILDKLNDRQREAVTAPAKPTLLLIQVRLSPEPQPRFIDIRNSTLVLVF